MYLRSNDVQPETNLVRSARLNGLCGVMLLIMVATATTATLSTSEGSAQEIPQYWPYQGFLLDTAGSPINGNVSLTINVYSDALANTPVWTGALNAVTVNNGAFAVDLGEVGGEQLTEAINSGAAKYIGVAVNGGVELTPRTRIGAVPYATVSSNALALGGQPPSHFVTQEGLQAAIPNLDDLNAAIQEVRTIAEGAQTTATTNTETITDVSVVAEAGLTEDEARTLIGTFGYLTQEAIIALIDARGYLSANAITVLINELIDSRGYLDADALTARVNELIDSRGYLNADALTARINELIDDRGYLSADAITARIAELIDARGYLGVDAITALVNGLINDRDYTTEVEVRELATTIATTTVTAAETRLNARIDELITRMNALDAEQDQQDLARQQLSDQITALQTAVAQAGQSAATAQTAADNAQTTADNAQTAAGNAQTTANAAAQDAATALQTAQDALAAAGAGGAPFILGPSADEGQGKFEFQGHQGVRAAGEMCKTSYANHATAHYCSPGEVQAALSVGNYENNINGVETWMFPTWIQHNNGNDFEGDNDFCQSLLYNSGHVAQGTSMTILLDTGSTSEGTGIRMAFNNNRACSTALRVLCCR